MFSVSPDPDGARDDKPSAQPLKRVLAEYKYLGMIAAHHSGHYKPIEPVFLPVNKLTEAREVQHLETTRKLAIEILHDDLNCPYCPHFKSPLEDHYRMTPEEMTTLDPNVPIALQAVKKEFAYYHQELQRLKEIVEKQANSVGIGTVLVRFWKWRREWKRLSGLGNLRHKIEWYIRSFVEEEERQKTRVLIESLGLPLSISVPVCTPPEEIIARLQDTFREVIGDPFYEFGH